MAKFNKMWKAVRMCSTQAQPKTKTRELLEFIAHVGTGLAGIGFTGNVIYTHGKELYDEYQIKHYGPETQYYFDNMLKKIVTADYNPDSPKDYVERQQDDDLKSTLEKYLNNSRGGFFMLVGESGSGKTTLMQTLLHNEYKEGVLELSLSAETMIKRSATHGKSFIDQLEEGVWEMFMECATHPKRHRNLLDFVKHAKNIRKKSRGEDAHPLIIYITLESKKDLDYETMMDFAGAFSSVATLLSSKAKSCKTIVEFSKTAMSDDIKRLRPSDQTPFEVKAMTTDEFLEIGKQVLKLSKDKKDLADQYLKYYHDWLGGQTKTLAGLVEEGAGSGIESATAETKKEILTKLKAGIDAEFEASVKQLLREQPEAIKLLTAIATTGVEGFRPRNQHEDDIMSELMNRDSKSTLLRKVTRNSVRIHRYSHALYLHGMKEPTDKAEKEIKEVKEKFEMQAKSA